MVNAIRSISNDIIIDIHLCVDRPARYVEALAEAGANRIIFMFEALDKPSAIEMANSIRKYGMQAGISLNPSTPVDSAFPLLNSGLFDTVDLLAVQPGFGGQELQESVLHKIQELQQWIKQRNHGIQIMVDGGVNKKTSAAIRNSGADILVAGTFLFQHAISVAEGAKELRL
jgi:ribulose-phosphate 3-epimerase